MINNEEDDIEDDDHDDALASTRRVDAMVPHPTALAFSEALERHLRSDSSTSSSSSSFSSATHERLRQRTLQLGWRNRRSLSPSYPVDVVLPDGGGSRALSIAQAYHRSSSLSSEDAPEDLGTGAVVWPACLVLIKYLERWPALVRGASVLDLGAGAGATSIAAAALGASRVVATDGVPAVTRLVARNVAANGVGDVVSTAVHDWADGGVVAPFFSAGNPPDVVLVSDCVLPKLFPMAPLVDALRTHVGPRTRAYLSYEHRHFPEYDPRVEFRRLCADRGLTVRDVPFDQHHEAYRADDVELWTVTRATTSEER